MFRKILVIGLLLFILLPHCTIYADEAEGASGSGGLELYAGSAILIDAASGRVLYEKNADAQMAMASTTKIMTCIIALEYGNLQDTVKVSSYASSMPDVQLNIREGEEYRLEDLLYSLMLESHNDTAVAIAEHIGGSVEGFAELMNDKSKDIGAYDTNFVTPNGLDAENHYSTARDMALIGAYAIKNPEFIKVTNTSSYSFSSIDGNRRFDVSNKNAFLSQMEGAIGIKTGFTNNAGYCFVGALQRDNKTLVCVVLAAGWPPNKSYKWHDTREMITYGLKNYTYKVLFEPIKSYKKMPVDKGQKSSVNTYIDGNFTALVKEEEKVEYYYKYENTIEAPVMEGEIVGMVEITIDGETVWSYPIKARENVKKIDFKFSYKKVIKKYVL